MTAEHEIRNLLFRYCWLVDQGKYDELAEMFDEADIYFQDTLAIHHDKVAYANSFKQSNIHYEPDNSLRTTHMCIDPYILIDEENGTASAMHYTVVLQGMTNRFPPQIICIDLKYDTFKRTPEGKWKFASRKMGNRCLGDMSFHQINPNLGEMEYFQPENTLYFKECQEI